MCWGISYHFKRIAMAFNAGVALSAGIAGSIFSRYLLSVNVLRTANVQTP